jgi:hypothetical protein
LARSSMVEYAWPEATEWVCVSMAIFMGVHPSSTKNYAVSMAGQAHSGAAAAVWG